MEKLHPLLVKILEKRGIKSHDEINQFLSWDLKTLPNLSNLKDLDRAILRIVSAIKNGERILIYGDYDVDGTTSTALLYHFFDSINYSDESQLILFQPHRFKNGYGLNCDVLKTFVDKKVDLIISVDCGITNVKEAQLCRDLGIDLIITDHHKDAAEVIPPAFAVINPNRRDEDCDVELKALAGVGVAFVLALNIRKGLMKEGFDVPSVYDLLPFVAIGTLCDMVPLNKLNLRLVRHGLKLILKQKYPGINLFFKREDLRRDFVETEKVTFDIGPHINSRSRLYGEGDALKLLVEKRAEKAVRFFSLLKESNQNRKKIQNDVYEEAKAQFLKEIEVEKPSIALLYSPDWHEGVIGIVASKIVENFEVPALIFCDSEEKGILKASGRSIGDFDLFSHLNKYSEYFCKFGGHKKALGLSMPKEDYENFKKEILSKTPLITSRDHLPVDIKLTFKEISPLFVKQLNVLAPFGVQNPTPLFSTDEVYLKDFKILKDIHVSWQFQDKKDTTKVYKGISFNYLNRDSALHPENILSMQNQNNNFNLGIKYHLAFNYFKGNAYLQLHVSEVCVND